MSLGDVDLIRRPDNVFIRNSTSFFYYQSHIQVLNRNINKEKYKDFVNDKTEGHFINPSEFFTHSLKTSPMVPF